MYTVYDIANWFLANGKSVTNKKLQKLVYYAYAMISKASAIKRLPGAMPGRELRPKSLPTGS